MKKIPLSYVDQIFVGENAYPINFVFRYSKGIQPERLRTSLIETLKDFPPLTSHVEYDQKAKRWFFVPSNKDVAFSIRRSSSPDKALDTVVTLPNEPLIKVVFSEGDTENQLGVSISHAVADGFSYFFFMSSWFAKLAGKPHPLATHNRADLDSIAKQQQDDRNISISPTTFFERTGLAWTPEISREQIGPLFFDRVSYATKAPIEGASENALLAAECLHGWVTKSAKKQDSVKVACAVDLRQRVPSIPATYFGNAICGAGASWTMDNYLKMTNVEIAKQIHLSVSRTDTERAKTMLSTLATLIEQEGPDVLSHLHVAHPEQGILVTNLSRLPLATLDCGAGAPNDMSILTKAPNTFAVTRIGGTLYINSCERTAQ